MIRILVVDDHSLFREGLTRLLEAEPDMKIAGSCASATEALSIVDRESIDLVLLDYDLGDEQGLIASEGLKKKGFPGRILIVTAGMADSTSLRALESGCSGIFLKHSPPDQLLKAIRKVMSGGIWLDSRAVRSLVSEATRRSEEQQTLEPWSERESAVLSAVFEGLSNKEIALKLEISETAVKWAIQRLFQKTRSNRRHDISPAGHDLGQRDLARSRHGFGQL